MAEPSEQKIELKQTGIEVKMIGEDGNAFAIWPGEPSCAGADAGKTVKAFMDEVQRRLQPPPRHGDGSRRSLLNNNRQRNHRRAPLTGDNNG